MFKKLFLLFTIVPLVEIFFLFQIGKIIGGWYTIGFILLTAFLGVYLIKRTARSFIGGLNIGAILATGQSISDKVVDGILLVIAGAFLVTPGVVTDLTALFILTPWGNSLMKKKILDGFSKKINSKMSGFSNEDNSNFYTIDKNE
ncbi:FxsA family protein [bacterium]|nr:FxsA family protein [bacterium]